MQTTRIMYIFFGLVFIFMLILVLLLTNIQLIAFNSSYYETQYEKFQVAQDIGIDQKDLMAATNYMLDYLDNKRDDLDFQMTIKGVKQEFFSERDKLHMIDVKNLFVSGKMIRNIAFWYCALFIGAAAYKMENRLRSFSKLFIYTFAAGIVPIIILVILMNIDFYKYFTVFHEIFFSNDLWQLDFAKDRLINMYPEAFFSNIAFRIAFYYIGELALLLVLGITGTIYDRRNKLVNSR